MALGVPATRIHEIINERRGISADTVKRLARYFGGDGASWLNLQATYDLIVSSRGNIRGKHGDNQFNYPVLFDSMRRLTLTGQSSSTAVDPGQHAHDRIRIAFTERPSSPS